MGVANSSLQTGPPQRGVDVTRPIGRSLWHDAWRRFRKNKLAVTGMTVLILIVLLAIFAPFVAPFDPSLQLIWGEEGVAAKLAPPSVKHWFGTDLYGRDILSRVIYGTRISLSIALASTLVSATIGVALGAIAGYYGGKVDDWISWFINVIYAFPFLLFVLTIVAFLQPSLTIMFVAIGVVSWPSIARVIRGQIMSVKETEFVEAARALGVGDFGIIVRHILPNVLAPVIIQSTVQMGTVILLEASLSYLGFGTQPPTPSWGLMVAEGQQYLAAGQWWWSLYPGLAIVLTVLGFNLCGDGLRDALDPRMK